MTEPLATDLAMHDSYVFPASYGQQRLWFLHQLDPSADRVYHLRIAVGVDGPLDAELLQRALEVLVQRHEALRTRFVLMDVDELAIGEQLAQVVSPTGRVPVRELDLTEAPEIEVRKALTAETDQSFDLESGPLLRGCVARVGSDRHILLLTVHHIISDGWSLAVLGEELSTAYAALADGREPDLPELSIQYADFAIWQREQKTNPEYHRHLDYWRGTLADLPPLDLPTDRPRTARQSYRGSRVPVRLPARVVATLAALGRAEGATLFMVLLASWQAVLGRLSGSTDFGVGTPVAGRSQLETEPLIGFFVHTVVLRTDLSGWPTFQQLVHRVRERAFDAYLHQDIPFEKLVEDLVPERDLSRSPIFQVWFAYQDTPHAALQLPGAAVEPMELPSTTAAFDLALVLHPAGDEVTGWLEYSCDLFDEPTAQNLASQWQMLLAGAAAEPTAPVWTLPLLNGPDLDQLREMSGRDVGPPEHRCLPDMIEAWARHTPEATAVCWGDTRVGYAELDRRANRLAHWLRSRGVLPGQVVGICLPRTGDLVAALLAVWKCGAASLPLDPDLPQVRRESWVRDSDAWLVLTEAELAAHETRIQALPDISPGVTIHLHSLACLSYTSGSAGIPKGVAITHQSIAALVTAMGSVVGLRPGATWGALTTVSSGIAGLELFGALAAGGCVALLERDEMIESKPLARRLTELDVNVVQTTPSRWRTLTATGWQPHSGLRVLCGGEVLPEDLAATLTAGGARLWNVYGPTETTVWSTAAPMSPDEPVSLGRPLPGEWAYILDDHLQPAPLGVVGELYIGGIGVARGYQGRPGLTAQRFLPDPSAPSRRLYRTGDLVRRLPSGDLVFLGRRDDQITGKVDREALPDLTPRPRLDADQPLTPLHAQVLQVVRRLLGRDDISVNDKFFEVGGNSMLAARLVVELRRVLEVRLSVRQIFELATVERIATAQAPSRPVVMPRPPGAEPVLSFDQQRLWLEDQLRPRTAYNVHGRRRLLGDLDVAALERSIGAIIVRHEALRTTFPSVDARPIQAVDDPDEQWRLSFEDLSGHDIDRDGAAQRLADEHAATSFDLAHGPLFCCLLIRLSDTVHLLSVTMHHIISDGWSIGLFIRELSELYRVGGDLSQADLPALPIQYRDYAVWQRAWLSGEILEAQVGYWRHQLADAPLALTLPVARRRSVAQGVVGGRMRSGLAGEETAALHELCRKHGVTLFMTLLAAMATVLGRWSGQHDVVIGAPVSTRNDERTDHLIGLFVNTLPMRVDLSGDPAFADLLRRVHKVALDGYVHHSEAPFDVLVNELRPPRDPTRTPLFQVCLTMIDVPEENAQLGDISVEPAGSPVQPSKFDLNLFVQESDGALRFELTFHADRYEARMIRIFLDQLRALLRAVTADPTRSIADYPLQDPELVARTAAAPADGPVSRPHRVVQRHALRRPNQVAVTDSAGQWSYQQLSCAADQVAQVLAERDSGAAGQVGVVKRRTAGFVAAVLGCMKAGVPFAIIEAGMVDSARQLYVSTVLDPDPPSTGGNDAIDLRALLSHETDVTRPPSEHSEELPDQHPDWAVERLDLAASDRFAVLSGSSGIIMSALSTALFAGATLCIPDDATVGALDSLVDWLQKTSVSVVYLNPPLLRAMAAQDPVPQLPMLRYVFVPNTGELTYQDVSVVSRLSASCRCVSIYRVTRTGQPLAVFAVPDTWRQERAPLRVPLSAEVDGVWAELLNSAGHPVATGEVGEICVAGQHTGDLGRRLHDGTLELASWSAGARADTAETVAALRDLPHVHDAIVTEYLDTDGRAALAAYVACRDSSLSTADLRQHLVTQLPEYVVPKTLLLLDRLPLSPDGEYDLAALPDPVSASVLDDTYAAPRTPIEWQLTDIFEELLDVDRVGVHDTFFELNGFSLLATQLASRIRETFKVDLSLRDVFTSPTVEGLAQLIVRAQIELADADELQALLEEIE